MSDSLQPHELQPARLLCPWDSPGKNTGVGCHALLQIFQTRRSNLSLLDLLLAGGPFTCWDTRDACTSYYLAVKSRDTVMANVPIQRSVPLLPWLNVLESPSSTFMDKQPLPRAWLDLKLATQDSSIWANSHVNLLSSPSQIFRFNQIQCHSKYWILSTFCCHEKDPWGPSLPS